MKKNFYLLNLLIKIKNNVKLFHVIYYYKIIILKKFKNLNSAKIINARLTKTSL